MSRVFFSGKAYFHTLTKITCCQYWNN